MLDKRDDPGSWDYIPPEPIEPPTLSADRQRYVSEVIAAAKSERHPDATLKRANLSFADLVWAEMALAGAWVLETATADSLTRRITRRIEERRGHRATHPDDLWDSMVQGQDSKAHLQWLLKYGTPLEQKIARGDLLSLANEARSRSGTPPLDELPERSDPTASAEQRDHIISVQTEMREEAFIRDAVEKARNKQYLASYKKMREEWEGMDESEREESGREGARQYDVRERAKALAQQSASPDRRAKLGAYAIDPPTTTEEVQAFGRDASDALKRRQQVFITGDKYRRDSLGESTQHVRRILHQMGVDFARPGERWIGKDDGVTLAEMWSMAEARLAVRDVADGRNLNALIHEKAYASGLTDKDPPSVLAAQRGANRAWAAAKEAERQEAAAAKRAEKEEAKQERKRERAEATRERARERAATKRAAKRERERERAAATRARAKAREAAKRAAKKVTPKPVSTTVTVRDEPDPTPSAVIKNSGASRPRRAAQTPPPRKKATSSVKWDPSILHPYINQRKKR